MWDRLWRCVRSDDVTQAEPPRKYTNPQSWCSAEEETPVEDELTRPATTSLADSTLDQTEHVSLVSVLFCFCIDNAYPHCKVPATTDVKNVLN
jgi:hypothetical protein